jgi:hypothetical protein
MSLPTRAPSPASGRCLAVLSLLSLLAICARPAAADLVIELYADERPSDADKLLAPVRALLEEEGHVAAPKLVAEALIDLTPQSGIRDPKLTVEAIAAQIDVGVKSYLRGEYQVASGQLKEAIATAHANPALVVSDDKAPQWMTRGLAAMALARARQKDGKGAAEAMAEQLRSFPSMPVTVEEFGSDGSELYNSTRRALEGAPRGGLTVTVTDPNARIFVNELGRGRGSVALRELTPGSYRVLVQSASTSRRYTVAIDGAAVELAVDWDLDVAFTSTPAWIGFALPPAAAERGEAAAARLAARLLNDDLLVIGLSSQGGARKVVAMALERVSGTVRGRAEMPAGDGAPWSAKQVRDFLRALRGEPSPATPAGPQDRRRPPSGAGVARWPAYLFAGLALAAAGAAVATRDDDDVFPAMLVGAGGFAITAVGVYFDIRVRARRATVGLTPAATGGMASVGWKY